MNMTHAYRFRITENHKIIEQNMALELCDTYDQYKIINLQSINKVKSTLLLKLLLYDNSAADSWWKQKIKFKVRTTHYVKFNLPIFGELFTIGHPWIT